MKHFLLLLVSIFSFSSYAQFSFEEGYFINNAGQKTTCLIRNMDWLFNPTGIEYKLTEDQTTISSRTIGTVKEFAILGKSKYVRFKGKIDKSSDDMSLLSTSKYPEFRVEEMFLKAEIEGKASLYLYSDGKLKRYFFKTDSSDIEQLIYKRYIISPGNDRYLVSGGKMDENDTYKQQILIRLKCSTISKQSVQGLVYKSNSLKRLFERYNKCHNSENVYFESEKKKDLFNLNLRPRYVLSSMHLKHLLTKGYSLEDKNKLGFNFGIEFEFILSFNMNRWSIIIEPLYQQYKGENANGSRIVELDYKSVFVPVGLRYNYYLSDKSRIFVNASFGMAVALNSTLKRPLYKDMELPFVLNWTTGLGYNYNDKYSLEFRYGLPRNIVRHNSWHSNYNVTSIIFGYSLF